MKNYHSLSVLLLSSILLTACGETSTNSRFPSANTDFSPSSNLLNGNDVVKFEVTSTKDSTPVGTTIKFDAYAVLRNGVFKRNITWSTSDATIATISPTGLLTGKRTGYVDVIAKYETYIERFSVYIEPPLPIAIDLTTNSDNLSKGNTTTASDLLDITYTLPNGLTTASDGADIRWTSSDNTILDISEDGSLTAKNIGTATLTASLEGVTSSITLNVVPATVTKLNFDEVYSAYELPIGLSRSVPITADYDNGLTEQALTNAVWQSSDESVVTVDNNGRLTSVSTGYAQITVTANGFTETVDVTVSDARLKEIFFAENDETELPINFESVFYTFGTFVNANEEETIYFIEPTNLAWTSSNQAVGTFDAEGLFQTKNAGNTTVTANLNGSTQTFEITVPQPSATPITISCSDYFLDQTRFTKTKWNENYNADPLNLTQWVVVDKESCQEHDYVVLVVDETKNQIFSAEKLSNGKFGNMFTYDSKETPQLSIGNHVNVGHAPSYDSETYTVLYSSLVLN